MENRIPKRGDKVYLGKHAFVVTEVRNNKVYGARRLQTISIEFAPWDDLVFRQSLIREKIKDQLPIELISVVLNRDGREVDYGLDDDLLHADSLTITYTQ